MRLTTHTDYALRVLMHAALSSDDLDKIDFVAEDFGISRNHLAKVVHNLSTLGYLQTVRGRNGGFRLARDADEISVGQVIREFESDFNVVECFDSTTSQCCFQSNCVLARELANALEVFLSHLDGVRLSDLVRPRRILRVKLGMIGGKSPRRSAE
jgi:Rrf2 family nitric oxide-sensitive transcriptional repressor